jgi:hypothetical protein
VSKIIVDNIESTGTTVTVNDALSATSVTGLSASSLTTGTLPNAQLAAGTIVQVVTTTKSDISIITTGVGTYTTILTGTITPTSTSNHIMVFVNLCFSQDEGRYSIAKLYRDSTEIGQGDADGSRTRGMFGANTDGGTEMQYSSVNSSSAFKDSPSSTSSIDYTVRVGNPNTAPSSKQLVVNSSGANDNGNYTLAGISTLTLMEVKG